MRLQHFAAVLSTVLAVNAGSLPLSRRQTSQNTGNVVRNGSELQLNGKRWTAAGANVFWLGMDESVTPPAGEPYYAPTHASYPTKGRVTEMMAALSAMGATAARAHTCGVNVGNPLALEPSLGVFNDKAFDSIDWAVYQAGLYGIRLLVPLTDNYDYYHGGKFVFLRWRNIAASNNDLTAKDASGNYLVQQFFTNSTVISDFKQYITYLLTHRNQYTNLTYAEDPTIFAYETGNELGGPQFGDMNVPNSWTQQIASLIKQLAPNKLIVDGTYGINRDHFSIKEIDIFSDHYYPMDLGKMQKDISAVQSTNRVYHIGEYDWRPGGSVSLASFFSAIETQMAKYPPVLAGDFFWSLFGHNVPDCKNFARQNDGLAIQYGNPSQTQTIAQFRDHFYKVLNKTADGTVPAVPCPSS